MAFKEYDLTQSIEEMNARQLRLYISRGAKQANERLKTMKDIPAYLADIQEDERLKGHISTSGDFLAGTSSMNKKEMQDYAKQLRDFNFMDTKSKYARDVEYLENKSRYETFIKNQIAGGGRGAEYWSKYIGKNGRVLKGGYQDYKQYIDMIKNVMPYISTYGYETIKKYYAEGKANMRDPQRIKTIERLLVDTYIQNRNEDTGKGMTPEQLNDAFFKALKEYDETHFDSTEAKIDEPAKKPKKPKKSKSFKGSAPAAKKPKKKKSGNTIGVKAGKKMKGESIRERQGTS